MEPRGRSALKLIVAYKLVKAGAELAGGLLLFFASARLIGEMRVLADSLRAHATASWSLLIADRLVHAATTRRLAVVALASLTACPPSSRDGRCVGASGQELDAAELVPGDLVLVLLGNIVPADMTLAGDGALSVDQWALAGESLPVDRKSGDATYRGCIV